MNLPPGQYVLQVVLPVPLAQRFDYLCPPQIAPIQRGTRVLVPFGKRRLVGMVSACTTKSSLPVARLLPVIKIFEECEPLLNKELMDLLDWCTRYYKHAPGEVVFNALPPALRRAPGNYLRRKANSASQVMAEKD